MKLRFKLKSPFVRRSVFEHERQLRREADAELQRCISTMFAMKRKHDDELVHLYEQFAGSPIEIGGMKFRYKGDS